MRYIFKYQCYLPFSTVKLARPSVYRDELNVQCVRAEAHSRLANSLLCLLYICKYLNTFMDFTVLKARARCLCHCSGAAMETTRKLPSYTGFVHSVEHHEDQISVYFKLKSTHLLPLNLCFNQAVLVQ